MTSEYTYDRIERAKTVKAERIEGLSRDAAFEIARANSVVGKTMVSTIQGKDSSGDIVKVWVFQNGNLVNEYLAGSEED